MARAPGGMYMHGSMPILCPEWPVDLRTDDILCEISATEICEEKRLLNKV